jgi:hypothetical protein
MYNPGGLPPDLHLYLSPALNFFPSSISKTRSNEKVQTNKIKYKLKYKNKKID